MHIVYVDESANQDAGATVISALTIPAASWVESFARIRQFRRQLNQTDGMYVQKELHAWELVSGRGDIATGVVTKFRRCEIFKEHVRLATHLPDARLLNAVFPSNQLERAIERLLNRINTCVAGQDSHFLLVCDQGKEETYTRLARRMRVYNPIPSRFRAWDSGAQTKSVPLQRMIEDPFFKDYRQSYFIQLVDMCCFALLRWEFPIASRSRYGVDRAFDALSPILCREASGRDPEGILRP